MKKVYTHKEKRKLNVGQIYNFLVIKTIVLPEEEEYFILKDPLNPNTYTL